MEKGLDLRQAEIALGFSCGIGSIDAQNFDPTLRDVAQDVVEQVADVVAILELQRAESGEIQVCLQPARLGREGVSGKHQVPDGGSGVCAVAPSDPQTRIGLVRCGQWWEFETEALDDLWMARMFLQCTVQLGRHETWPVPA